MHEVRVAPSLLSADFARLGAQVETVMDAGARVIHVGVLDVHLMVERPERRVEEFASAGADSIAVHWEATPHVHYALKAVRDAGRSAGLAINPATPPAVVSGLSDDIDHV